MRPNYLNIIKEIFFYRPEYKLNSLVKDFKFKILGNIYIYNNNNNLLKSLDFKYNNIAKILNYIIKYIIFYIDYNRFIFLFKLYLKIKKYI